MKKIALILSFITILLCFVYSSSIGQVINFTTQHEKIKLFTDRTLFISGEDISFVAYIFHNNIFLGNSNIDPINISNGINKHQQKLSEIIYVELITPTGEKKVSEKFLCDNSCGKGNIPIPKDLLTGVYYIKAYTKFMRNNGPSTYNYTLLKIVNPFKPDVLAHNSTNENIKDSLLVNNSTNNQDVISISTDKDEYLTRERVNIQIKGISLTKQKIDGINLSVIPECSYNEQRINLLQSVDSLKEHYYYPEPMGMSLTGMIKDSKSDTPITNTTVNLSILGNYKDFMAVRTNSSGRFFFKMPNLKGARDIFICTEMIYDAKSTILIDNDFCNKKVELPTPAFKITPDEKRAVLNLAQNSQITSYFSKNELKADSDKFANNAFYGEPQEKIFFDKYIQLPTIEDYINEIIPTLKIRTNKGQKYFKIYRTRSELEIYKPLVLLDLVAIDNPDKILSLPPQNISSIETVNSPYVKGDIIYGGIISFFSRNGDFAGIDLPSSGVFLDFKFLGTLNKSSREVKLNENQPDSRNTLLWEPEISLDSNNSYERSFITSDTPGKYTVLLRGITKEGKVFSFKKSILIKNRISNL